MQWGSMLSEEFANFGFLKNKENDIFVITRSISEIDFSRLRINTAGMYLGEIKDGRLRLSIEGSQIIGKNANKNVLEVDYERCEKWTKGEDIELKDEEKASAGKELSGFVIIKYEDNFLGSGKLKDNRIINFVPKIRRVKELA